MTDYYIKKYKKYVHKLNLIGGNYTCNSNMLDDINCVESKDGAHTSLDLCEKDIKCATEFKTTYKKLYNHLITILAKQITTQDINIIQILCTSLMNGLKEIYTTLNEKEKKSINYDVRLLITVVSMLLNDKFTSSLNIDKIIEYNKYQNLDADKFYYIEEGFLLNINDFFSEFDKLEKTKKSSIFFKSNLVNISLLFKCFNDRCIDKISPSTSEFYNNFKSQFTESDLNNIHNNFNKEKNKLLLLLLNSYKDFEYEKIKLLYIEYLNFYHTNINMLKLTITPTKEELTTRFNNTIKIIELSGDKYFIYLSCNLPSFERFEKFEISRILISYLGFRENPDEFYDTIETVDHDFADDLHGQYTRKITYSSSELLELRKFWIKLYEYCADNKNLLNDIIIYMHDAFYEQLGVYLHININSYLNKIIEVFSRISIFSILNNIKIIYKNKIENTKNENFKKMMQSDEHYRFIYEIRKNIELHNDFFDGLGEILPDQIDYEMFLLLEEHKDASNIDIKEQLSDAKLFIVFLNSKKNTIYILYHIYTILNLVGVNIDKTLKYNIEKIWSYYNSIY